MKTVVLMGVLMGVLGVAGCGAYTDCDAKSEPLDLVVSADESGEVSLDWEPGQAATITVTDAEGKTVWHLQCGGPNLSQQGSLESSACISTPIVYGDEPDSKFLDTENLRHAQPLVSGEVYTFSVVATTPGDSSQCGSDHSADVEFTAP